MFAFLVARFHCISLSARLWYSPCQAISIVVLCLKIFSGSSDALEKEI